MPNYIQNRMDWEAVFNASRFMLRHYARGYYPVSSKKATALPVNRMFFPLENPNGPENFIEDSFRRYTLIPGKMYFVPGFLPARFHLDDTLYFLSIQTSLEIFPGVELFSGCSRMLEIPAPAEFGKLMQIFDSREENTHYQDAVKAGILAFGILASILDMYSPEEFSKPLSLKRYIKLMDYLDTHGNAQTSVRDLAELENESREGFTRHFSADTGITPKQLIDRFLIARSLTLINQGCNFKEVAEHLRFRDLYSFSRYFKRNMGESPRSWRDRQIKSGGF